MTQGLWEREKAMLCLANIQEKLRYDGGKTSVLI